MFRAVLAAAEAQDQGIPIDIPPLILGVTGAIAGTIYGCKLNRRLGGPCWMGGAAGYFLGGLAGEILAVPLTKDNGTSPLNHDVLTNGQ